MTFIASIALLILRRRAEKELLVAQVQHVRGVAQGGVDVVRDHDNRDVIAEVHELDEVIQFPRRHGVETRDRLIEQQELARGAQGTREQHALLLAAG